METNEILEIHRHVGAPPRALRPGLSSGGLTDPKRREKIRGSSVWLTAGHRAYAARLERIPDSHPSTDEFVWAARSSVCTRTTMTQLGGICGHTQGVRHAHPSYPQSCRRRRH